MKAPAWWPSWEGETVVIVASGPSAKDAPIDLARGSARFIAINTSGVGADRLRAMGYADRSPLCPWADILFACDIAWWNQAEGCPEFTGLKLTVDKEASRKFADVYLVNSMKPDDRFYTEPLGTVGWGGNSGFHCLNLAAQFRPRKIILVGYDMHVRNGQHWHSKHPAGMNNPTYLNVDRWRRAVDEAAKHVAKMGVSVINTSLKSALQNYPKMTFSEALAA